MASLKDLLNLLSTLYSADELAISGQVKGRVQNLQKMGVPIGGNIGKGKRLDYGRSEIYQVVTCFELAELGLNPSQSSFFVKEDWAQKLEPHYRKEWTAPGKEDLLLIVMVELMSSTWKQPESPAKAPLSASYVFTTPKKLWTAVEFMNRSGMRHFSTINVSALVRDVEREMTGILPPVAPA